MNTLTRFSKIALALACLAAIPSATANTTTDTATAEKKLNKITQEIVAVKAIIDKTQRQQTRTEKALQQAKESISKIQKNIHNTHQTITRTTSEIERLKKQNAQLQATKKRQEDALLQDLNGAYRSGKQEYIKLLLNQQNPEKLSRVMRYYEYFSDARRERLQGFSRTLAEIRTNQQNLDASLSSQQIYQQKLVAEEKRLQQARAKSQAALKTYQAEIKRKHGTLAQLNTDQKALQKLLKDIEEQLADIPDQIFSGKSFRQSKGKLPWPAKGKFLTRYGQYPKKGSPRSVGVEIKTASRAPVRSIYRGQVLVAKWLRGYGMVTIIKHDKNHLALYGKTESLLKEPGDWVEANEIIAYSGVKPARLYFEIRHKGKPINPSKWCTR